MKVTKQHLPNHLGSEQLDGRTNFEVRASFVGASPNARLFCLQDFRLMLLRLHRLQRLHLEVMHMEMLPEALVQLDHLTELHLERCNLPGGPPPPVPTRSCHAVSRET